MASPLSALRPRLPEMLSVLESVVMTESPSSAPEATAACANVIASAGRDLLGAEPEITYGGGAPILRWSFGPRTRVLLIGHLDTVWPAGTTARWPFATNGDRASGPGIFDMKAGLVQGLFALSVLGELEGVTFLVNADEETGSLGSRTAIEAAAEGAEAALVLEPASAGALKVARKGVSGYKVAAGGRAAHAGLEPEKGINAVEELAHVVLALRGIARPEQGTTVVPTVVAGGTTSNTVPAEASVVVNVRAWTTEEQERVDRELRALRATVPGASLTIEGKPNRPPLEESSARELYARAAAIALDLGLGELAAARVGGGSDGNFTAARGVPTLDGLGAVGDGAHAEGEWILTSAMPERAALVASLVAELL